METLDLRRIIDLHFHRNVWQLCCDRGTVGVMRACLVYVLRALCTMEGSKVLLALLQIVIHSDNDVFPRLELTTFGTRQVFEKLKQVSLQLGSASSL